jgi:Arc/MetJ-type ribon-helix-helix transcriptional regulator
MKLRLDLNNNLLRDAMRLGEYKSRKETIEAALLLLIRLKKQAGIRKLRGKIQWEGNLEELRLGRTENASHTADK